MLDGLVGIQSVSRSRPRWSDSWCETMYLHRLVNFCWPCCLGGQLGIAISLTNSLIDVSMHIFEADFWNTCYGGSDGECHV